MNNTYTNNLGLSQLVQRQSGIIINNDLPPLEGVSHFNVNYHTTSKIGRFLSPYALSAFSPDQGINIYSCPEAYFVEQRYTLAGVDTNAYDIPTLYGKDIIDTKRIISDNYRYPKNDSLLDSSHGDNVKEVLRDVLLAKLYSAILTHTGVEFLLTRSINKIDPGETYVNFILNKPFLCYLTQMEPNKTFRNTVVFKQLSWMTVVIKKAIDDIKITCMSQDQLHIPSVIEYVDSKISTIEKDILFYNTAIRTNNIMSKNIRNISNSYFIC